MFLFVILIIGLFSSQGKEEEICLPTSKEQESPRPFLATALLQLVVGPAIEEDEEKQPEHPGEIAPQHIGQPVFTSIDTRKANRENHYYCQDLQWQQEPIIAPLTHGSGETQIEEKAIIDNIVLGITRGKAVELEE